MINALNLGHIWVCTFAQMVNLYYDPAGEKIFHATDPSRQTEQTMSSEHHSMAVGLSELTDTEKIKLLTSRVRTLEEKMEEKNKHIIELETIIKS